VTDETWSAEAPGVRPELLMSGALMRGPRRVHLIKDLAADASFEVGEKEYFLISRLDGRTPLTAIGDAYVQRFGRRVDDRMWRQVLAELHRRRLLSGDADPASARRSDAPEDIPRRRRSTLLRGEARVVRDPGRAVDLLYRHTRWLQTNVVVWVLLAAVGAMYWVLAANLDDLLRATAAAFTRWPVVVAVVVTLWVSTAVHELAHGVVARRHGGTVTGIGVLWRFPMIIPYCRVENYLYLRRRRDRVVTAAAGAAANLVFLLPWFVGWLLNDPPDPVLGSYLAAVLVLGTVLGLGNLVPIPPLDGYAMVSHALGMIDLRAESRRFVVLVATAATGRGSGVGSYPRWARAAYAGYALGSFLVVGALAVAAVLVCLAVLPESLGVWRVALPITAVIVLIAGMSVDRRTRGAE
jgi:putative peptide zinc metalloprotease protein